MTFVLAGFVTVNGSHMFMIANDNHKAQIVIKSNICDCYRQLQTLVYIVTVLAVTNDRATDYSLS